MEIYLAIFVFAITMLVSWSYGYHCGRQSGHDMINYYRNLWLKRIEEDRK